MQNKLDKSHNEKILGASISFVIMTTVYMYLAKDYPMEQRLKSSIGHSSFCFFMTFFAIIMMNFFYGKYEKLKFSYGFTVVSSGGVAIALMTIVHLFLGTPDLLNTILFSIPLGAPFFLLYPYKLVKSK